MKRYVVAALFLALSCTALASTQQGWVRIKNDSDEPITVNLTDRNCMQKVGSWQTIAPHTLTAYYKLETDDDGTCFFSSADTKYVTLDFGRQESASIYLPSNIIDVKNATSNVLVRNEGELGGVNRKTLIILKSSNAVVKVPQPSQPETALTPLQTPEEARAPERYTDETEADDFGLPL